MRLQDVTLTLAAGCYLTYFYELRSGGSMIGNKSNKSGANYIAKPEG